MPGVDASVAARRVVLVRHAAAEPGGSLSDLERPLREQGRRQLARTASWLAASGWSDHDLALVSPAVRAQQTWRGLGRAAPPVAATAERTEPALYETSATALVHLLAATDPQVHRLVVVAHEPVLSGAAAALAADDSDLAAHARVLTGLGTAQAAVLRLAGTWADLAQGACRLLAVGPPRAG